MLCGILTCVGKYLLAEKRGEKPEASQSISDLERDKEFGERREWSKALMGSLNPAAHLSSSLMLLHPSSTRGREHRLGSS